MSDEQSKLEEGPQREKEQKEGPNSCLKRCLCLKRCFLSILLPCLIIWYLIVFGGIMIVMSVIVFVMYLFAGTNRYLLMSVIAIILDPLFFYFPVLNDEKKCIHADKTLGITATILRSVIDFLKLVYIISNLTPKCNDKHLISMPRDIFRKVDKIGKNKSVEKEDKNGENKSRLRKFVKILKVIGRVLHEKEALRECILFLVDILAILPIPQVFVILGIRGAEVSILMTFFIIQYVLRVIRTFFLFTHARTRRGLLTYATWAIVAFCILLYMQSSHVFGALWYYFAIEKATDCWKKACINHTGCVRGSFLCDDSLGDYNFVNITSCNFGLYNDALQSGILEETYFFKKWISCLKWGLQNVSAFGQNLPTITDVGENIFAICMTNIGVVLFVFFFGKMQSDIRRSEKIYKKWEQIRKWPNFKEIDPEVQEQIRKDKRKNWQNKIVKLDGLMTDLQQGTARKARRQIGRELLKKVQYFQRSKKWLDLLCNNLKPVFFSERTRIIREGDQIDEMLFVLKGELWTYASKNVATAANLTMPGDFFGEELIDWALKNFSPNLPISTGTIQALTDVEAFALMAGDLKKVILKYRESNASFIQFFWRFRKRLCNKRQAK